MRHLTHRSSEQPSTHSSVNLSSLCISFQFVIALQINRMFPFSSEEPITTRDSERVGGGRLGRPPFHIQQLSSLLLPTPITSQSELELSLAPSASQTPLSRLGTSHHRGGGPEANHKRSRALSPESRPHPVRTRTLSYSPRPTRLRFLLAPLANLVGASLQNKKDC